MTRLGKAGVFGVDRCPCIYLFIYPLFFIRARATVRIYAGC